MKKFALIFYAALISVASAKLFINPYPSLESHVGDIDDFDLADGDDGVLYVTKLLKAGKAVEEIQKMAYIDHPDLKAFPGYSGFFTVNESANSNMFFWYFPAQHNSDHAPTVLWLQGGPGASSLFGLFTENGPFVVTKSGKVKARKYSWNINCNLLYLDNPVGTGFSFTDEDGYARNEVDVGNNLYEALVQFFTLFPQLQTNPFYVTGESYAGKYVPSVSYTIHQRNPDAKLKIPLKGLAIGNGLSDPGNQMYYGDYLYQLGLIDANGLELFHQYEAKGRAAIKRKDFKTAFEVFDLLINMDQLPSGSLFKNMTGFTTYFNYLQQEDDGADKPMGAFLKRSDVRLALHVGNLPFHGLDDDENKVEEYLKLDVMDSVAPYVIELLKSYRVCIYNGQLDIIVAYPLTIHYLQNLAFDDAEKYKAAPRYIWKVGNDIAGFVHEAGNLVEVLVRNAGHMVPHDQPMWAFDLITRFTHSKGFQ